MIECSFNIAPVADKKIMQAPCPPAIPIRNNSMVARVLPNSIDKIKAARI